MAITRYAGDRFTIAAGETKPTGVLDGGYLIDTGNLTQFVKRTVGGTSQWSQLAGGGGGGTPGGSTTQVQFNDGGSFAGDADLTFTNGNQLNVNKLSIAANIIDSNSSIGEGGMVLTNEGTTGVHWKNIESVLSGVGGSGVANYVARWSDEDTLTTGIIYDNAQKVGISTASPQAELHIYAGTTAGDHLLVESTNTAAGDAPDLVLYRNSPSPANSDDLGIIRFRGKNNGTDTGFGENKVIYADIEAEITSVVSGAEGAALKFYTQDNGSLASRMVITGANIGIGTATPAVPLHITKSAVGDNEIPEVIRLSTLNSASPSWSTTDGLCIGAEMKKANGTTITKQPIRFRYDGGDMATTLEEGNVGIGNAAPTFKLQVNGDVRINSGTAFLDDGQSIRWGGTAAKIDGSSGGDYLRFYTDGAERVRIISGGAVGVGTATPNAGSWSNAVTIQGASSVGLELMKGSSLYAFMGVQGSGSGHALDIAAYQNQSIRFRVGSNAGTTAVTILNDGKVGIGSTDPEEIVNVASAGAVTPGVIHDLYSTTTTRFPWIGLRKSGSNTKGTVAATEDGDILGKIVFKGVDSGSSFFRESASIIATASGAPDSDTQPGMLQFATSNTTSNSVKMTITSSGFVGIGTVTPAYSLQANGTNGGIIAVTRTTANTTGTIGHFRFGADLANVKGIQDGATDSARLEFETQATGGSVATRMKISSAGAIQFNTYGSGTHTGTSAYKLSVDSSGNIIETSIGAGAVDGSGTANTIPRWTDSDTIGDSLITVPSNTSVKINASGADAVRSLRIDGTNGSSEIAGFILENDGENAKVNLKYNIGNGTPATKVTLNHLGYVGIGTNAPAVELHINDASGLSAIRLTGGATSADGFQIMQGVTGVTNAGFSIYDVDATATRFVIDSSGNATIGGTSSQAKLNIRSSVSGNYLYMDDGASVLWSISANGSTSGVIQTQGTGFSSWKPMEFRANYFQFKPNNSEIMRVISTGVGIGTNAPDVNLHIYSASSPQFRIQDSTNNCILKAYAQDSDAFVGTHSDHSFIIGMNNTTKITVASALTTFADAIALSTNTTPSTSGGEGFLYKHGTNGTVLSGYNASIETGSAGSRSVRLAISNTGAITFNSAFTFPTTDGSNGQFLQTNGSGTVTWASAGSGTVTGSGTTNYVPKFTSSTALGNSALYDGGGSNIGIGTNNPYYALDVRFTNNATGFSGGSSGNWGGSGLRLQNASTTAGAMALIQFRTSDAEWFIGNKFISANTSDFIFNHEDSEKVRFTNDGKVGIGTATPEFKLQVENTVAAGSDNFILNVRNTTHASDSRAGIAFRMNNNTGSNWDGAGIQATNDGVSGAGHLTFGGVEDSTFTERVRIQVDGKVGIGTNVPAERLHVYKSGSDTPLRVETTSHVGVELKGGTSHDIYFLLADTSTNAKIGWDHSATALKFNASASFSDNHLVVKSTGVGIGTDAPSYLLHTYGATADQLLLERSNANDVELVIKNSEQSWVQGIDRSESNHYAICTGDSVATNKKIVIQTGGQIQFNTYGSATHTGTLAKSLGVDSSGNVIEFTGAGGTVDGSGTANYVAKWSDSDTIANSVLQDDGNRLAVGATPSLGAGILHLKDVTSNQAKVTLESANAYNSWINFSAASNEMSIGYDKSTVGGFVFSNSDTIASNIRMVILSGGSVGIGTATPDSKLEIAGGGYNSSLKIKGSGAHTGIQFEDSAGNTDGYVYAISDTIGFLDAGADWTIQSKNDDYIRFSTNGNTEHMRIKSDGKVGIGTNAPAALLNLFKTGANDAVSSAIYLQRAAGNYGAAILQVGNGSSGSEKLMFTAGHNSDPMAISNAKMTIQQDGNVGIGTTAPNSKLDLLIAARSTTFAADNGATWHDLIVRNPDNTQNAAVGLAFELNSTYHANAAAGIAAVKEVGSSDYGAGLAFITRPQSAVAEERVRITSTGKVGIGTSAPSEVLEVKGNIIIRGETNNRLKIANDSNNNWAEIGNDGATGANTLEFFTGSSSTSSLSITNGGYAAFAYASQVRLTLGSTGTPGNNDANWIRSNGANLEFNAASGDFNWEVGGAHKMRLTDGGFLGLGLGAGTDPFGTLHVNGTNGSNIHITRTSGGTTSTFGSIVFGNTDIDSSCAEITGDQDGANDSGRLEFGTQASVAGGVVTRMTIKGDGLVGIGTATPSTKFQVHSGDILITSGKQLISTNSYTQAPPAMLTTQGPSTGATSLGTGTWGIMLGPQHTRSSVANTYYPGIAFNHLLNNGGVVTYNNHPQAWIGTRLHDTPGSERAFLVFSTKGGTGVSASDVPLERMCIDPVDGLVGIGTTNPQVLLDVYTSDDDTARFESTSTSRSTVSIRSGSTGDAQVRFQNGAASKWSIGNDGGDSDKFKIAVGSGAFAASEAVIVDTSGNLSILGTLTEASSLALKENIEDFTPSLDIINKIRPVKYNKKKESKKEIGLIAEELAELFPELVDRDNQGNPSGVNYSRAVTVLLGGFKELYKEIEELKKRI